MEVASESKAFGENCEIGHEEITRLRICKIMIRLLKNHIEN